MKDQKSSYKCHGQKDINAQDDVHDEETKLCRGVYSNHCDYGRNEREEGHEEEGSHEAEKIFIVSLAHAGTDPGAMMVKSLHTDVAFVAMRSSRRTIYKAGIAELYFEVMGFYRNAKHSRKVPHLTVLVLLV